MKSFLRKFIPKSHFAFLILGFLAIDRVVIFFDYKIFTILFSGALLIVFYLLKNKRVSYFLFGIFIYFAFLSIETETTFSKLNILSLTEIKNFQKVKKPVIFQLENEIKKNYWKSTIVINEEKKVVIVYLKNWKEDFTPTFQCGSELIKLKFPQSSFGDYFLFLKKFGNFYLQFPNKKCHIVEKILNPKRKIRNYVESLLILGGMEDYSLDISLGLIFGDSSYLDKEFKAKAKEGGILHLFAASGLHIGIFTGFVYFLLSRIQFINYYALKIIPTIAALFYLYLLDFPVSLTRAFCFISILTLASMFFRKTHPTDVLLYSSFIIFLLDRDSYLSLSFNLSFSAVMGIFYFKNALDEILFHKLKSSFGDNLTISLSATIGTFPVLMYYFHAFSFGSVIVNYILVPLTSFILPVLYVAIFAELIQFPLLNKILWTYADLLIRIQAFLSDFLGERVGFYKEFDHFGIFHIALFTCFIALIFFCIFIYCKIIFIRDDLKNLDHRQDTKINQRKIFILSIFSFLIVFSFFIIGIIFSPEKKKINTEFVQIESNSFIIFSKKELYIGGDCKYNIYKLKKNFSNQVCKDTISKIFIEKESCIELLKSCDKKSFPKTLLFYDSSIVLWKDSFFSVTLEKRNESKKFQLANSSYVIFFRPDKDGLNFLQTETKNGFGKIVVIFPYKSKDNIDDWKLYQKILGINENWQFVSASEFQL
ncbi:MAG: ComEC/Rec2 family competence protein [Leptospiraceae bacterium]|nr:ComEC/Rec2 family competence protein [Leptospiraceae bacterium]NUM40128.1 ComEC/Rec2 family competence protein [Leptospiraceae bacterium]